MQIYLAYLCGKNACSWPSGRSLKDVLLENLNNDPLSVHHIFPKRFMIATIVIEDSIASLIMLSCRRQTTLSSATVILSTYGNH